MPSVQAALLSAVFAWRLRRVFRLFRPMFCWQIGCIFRGKMAGSFNCLLGAINGWGHLHRCTGAKVADPSACRA
jgi:hypothetical protein